MSEYSRNLAILLLGIMVLFLSIIAMAACCHDNMVMQKNNDRMRESIAEIIKQQERQASEIRQVKTDTEIMLRVVIDNVYLEEEDGGVK